MKSRLTMTEDELIHLMGLYEGDSKFHYLMRESIAAELQRRYNDACTRAGKVL